MPALGGGLLRGRVCSRGCLLLGRSPGPHTRGNLRGIRSRPTPKGEVEVDLVKAPPTATAAGGKHPTGMHSC